MNYGGIFLLPDEVDLLKKMSSGGERDRYTPGLMSLRENELVTMINRPAELDENHKLIMMYRINEDGKRFLLYLEREDAKNEKQSKHDCFISTLSIITIIASIVSAVSAIITLLK